MGFSGDSKEKRYFFGKRNMSNVNRCNQMISTGSGHWKGIGKEKQVMASSGSNQTATIIGVRKTLVFYRGKKRPHGGFRTHWIMHEFQLMGSSATTLNACQVQANLHILIFFSHFSDLWINVVLFPFDMQKLMTEREAWAVCCIYRKKAKSKRSTGAKSGNITREVGKIRPPKPSSSGSSEITETSSKGSDHEEEINRYCLHR